MARNAGATREQVETILAQYRQSGLTRREYCSQAGMTVYMLDYYQRRLCKLREREAAETSVLAAGARQPERQVQAPRIARVLVGRVVDSAPSARFVLTLGNGRRIEVGSGSFSDQDLARLIRVAEHA
jgi:hypothetical protein